MSFVFYTSRLSVMHREPFGVQHNPTIVQSIGEYVLLWTATYQCGALA